MLTANLYQGYPFDRLRRRLALEVLDPGTVDSNDVSCMSFHELHQLDPAVLDDTRLAEAYESTSGLRDDTETARFATELLRRGTPAVASVDIRQLTATLVREAMKANDPDEALSVLDRARALGNGQDVRTFNIWSAEIHARSGGPDAAAATYRRLLDHDPDDAPLALDAAETFIDNGYDRHAVPFLRDAVACAKRLGNPDIAQRASALLAAGDDPGAN
jgi:lipopolysaccharide biosynthesis regulator YciM